MKKLILLILCIAPAVFAYNKRTQSKLHGYIADSSYGNFEKLFSQAQKNITSSQMQEIKELAEQMLEQRKKDVELSQLASDGCLGAKIGLASSIAGGILGAGCLAGGIYGLAHGTVYAGVALTITGAGIIGLACCAAAAPLVALGIWGSVVSYDRIKNARTNSTVQASHKYEQAQQILGFIHSQQA